MTVHKLSRSEQLGYTQRLPIEVAASIANRSGAASITYEEHVYNAFV